MNATMIKVILIAMQFSFLIRTSNMKDKVILLGEQIEHAEERENENE